MALLWLVCTALFVAMAAVHTDIAGQFAIVGVCFVSYFLVGRFSKSTSARLIVALIAVFVTTRYVVWRLSETIPLDGPWQIVFGVALTAAELYGISIFLLGLFITVRPLRRSIAPLKGDSESWPTVDILVPTYNEPWNVVGPTLMAATQMAYPRHKMRVICCDDGGTEQKRSDSDPGRAAEAMARHLEFQRRCTEIGVDYITRARNENAKAGNLNHAMTLSSGELILILDADHVPTEDFLNKTVGQFLKDDKLFLVQTPHFFINPDPIEKNLGTFGSMPAENDLFYGPMQRGMDYWNASFFCGSAALLRRSALMEIGGIQTKTVTEDADTSLSLHAKGYTSAYINEPMVAGLQPATFVSLVKQRIRWAQGMWQILLLSNPLFRSGLTLAQRLCYLANIGFWTFPFARVLFLFTPPVFLIFGVSIYDASVTEFFAYALPHLILSTSLSHRLFGRHRWTFASELYETALSLYLLPALLKLIINPKRASFVVTAKDEVAREAHLSPLAPTMIATLVILLLSFSAGVWRLLDGSQISDAITIVLCWTGLNIVLVLGAIGAMWERPTPPGDSCAKVKINAQLHSSQAHVPVVITEFSLEGGVFVLDTGVPPLPGEAIGLTVYKTDGSTSTFDAKVVTPGSTRTTVRFTLTGCDLEQKMAAVHLAYGDSRTWRSMREDRNRNRPMVFNTVFVLARCITRGVSALIRAAGTRA